MLTNQIALLLSTRRSFDEDDFFGFDTYSFSDISVSFTGQVNDGHEDFSSVDQELSNHCSLLCAVHVEINIEWQLAQQDLTVFFTETVTRS